MNSYHTNEMAVGLESTTAKNTTQINSKGKIPSKLEIILHHLIKYRSINRFEAEKIHDHCLNSTISTLQNNYGIIIDRVRESVPCLNGLSTVSVNRYWLSPDGVNKQAAEVLMRRLAERRHEKTSEPPLGYKGSRHGS